MVSVILAIIIIVLICVIFAMSGNGAVLPQEVEKDVISSSYVEYVSQDVDSYEYCKNKFLNEDEKKLYDELLTAIKKNKRNTSIKISMSPEKAQVVYDYLRMDHPEIFWTAGLPHTSNSVTVLNQYNNSEIEKNCMTLVNTFTDSLYSINMLETEKEKVLYIKNLVENPNNYFVDNFSEYQKVVSMLGSNKAVMKYLFDRTNIKSSYIKIKSGHREYEYFLEVCIDDNWVKIEDVLE